MVSSEIARSTQREILVLSTPLQRNWRRRAKGFSRYAGEKAVFSWLCLAVWLAFRSVLDRPIATTSLMPQYRYE